MEIALYTAVSGIEEAFIAEAEDPAGIRAELQKKRKKEKSLLMGMCACVIIGIGILGAVKMISPRSVQPGADPSGAPVSGGLHEVVPFSAQTDPDADAYGEEELPEVCLTAQGIRYEQMTAEDAAACGIGESLPAAAFGAFLGIVEERFPGQETEAPVSSPEPSLAGAQVYYYAPTGGSAVLIAEKDGRCSVFAVTSWPEGRSFRAVCDFFGVRPAAEGIESVSFTVQTFAGDGSPATAGGALTGADEINSLCALLLQLTPEDPPADERAPTPQWYIDAWQAYKARPEDRIREDITLEIRFANGCRVHNVLYQPFLGNGYFDHMKELTPELNAALRGLLR